MLIAGVLLAAAPASASPQPRVPKPAASSAYWVWPVEGRRVVIEHFRASAQPWSSGHRGMDIAVGSDAAVRAPAPGVVAFRGYVVDRPLLTISHAGGLVTTLEPVSSELSPGDVVAAGETVGTLDRGGHTPAGALHVGVRWHGDYINPLLLFGGVPRAILLPCCEPLG